MDVHADAAFFSKDRTRYESDPWPSETDLLFNCIGFSVGLGNIWRFPYLAFKNGGGAFLIPYLLLTFVISMPLYYMELLVGQNSKLDPLNIGSFCPCFKGLGVSILLCTLVIQVYYNVIMAYALFYLLQTFRKALPWSECAEWWGADDTCYAVINGAFPCKSFANIQKNTSNCTSDLEGAADQFLKIHVLNLSSGLEDLGTLNYKLTFVLMVTWTIVCAVLIGRYHAKYRIKFKTIYVTAFFPFLVLTIYFCYTITLPGATHGLRNLFIPKWGKLMDITVWSEAAQSSMYSVSLGTGGLIVFGGKNQFHYNISRCALVSCLVDTFASILAAAVTFMTVGFIAEHFQLNFSEIKLSGYGLVFVTFPGAVTKMDISHFWFFLFFAMLFCMAMDSSVVMTETIAVEIQVLLFSSKKYSKAVVIMTSILFFLAELPCVTQGGPFILNMLDYYGGGQSLMGTVFLESVAFGWGYSVDRASWDIENMRGSPPSPFLKICWAFLTPISLLIIFVGSIRYSDLAPLYDIPYPWYANVVGWSIVAVILLPVPIWMAISLHQYRENVQRAFKPDKVWWKAVWRSQRQ